VCVLNVFAAAKALSRRPVLTRTVFVGLIQLLMIIH